jgi:hypothetical protein
VSWTGDVDAIANVNAARTVIVMQGDRTIMANFKEARPVNWLLIGFVVAGLVAGLVVFLVRRRRLGQTLKHGRKPARSSRKSDRRRGRAKKQR